jgi:hypothetical protein
MSGYILFLLVYKQGIGIIYDAITSGGGFLFWVKKKSIMRENG